VSRARTPAELRRFVQFKPDVEAVLQRCGLDTYDLLLIAANGEWTRFVFPSENIARTVADDLDVPLHEGWDDERLTQRFNRSDPWNTALGKRRAL
jgi:hypothetical protein